VDTCTAIKRIVKTLHLIQNPAATVDFGEHIFIIIYDFCLNKFLIYC